MTDFSKHFSITFTTKVLVLIIGTFAGIIIARFLGPEGKGIYVTLITLVGIISLLGSFGLESANTYFIGKKKFELKDIASTSLTFGLGIGTVLTLLFCILYICTNFLSITGINDFYVILGLMMLPFVLVRGYYQYILQGLHKFVEYNKIVLGTALFNLFLLVFVLIFLNVNVSSVIIVYIVHTVLTCILVVYVVSRYTTLSVSLKFDYFKEALSIGLKAYAVILVANLMLRLDILLVNYYLGAEAVGYYSVSVALAGLVLFIPSSITFLHFPMISSSSNEDSAQSLTSEVSRHNILLTILLSVVIIVVSQPLIPFLYGSVFIPSYNLLILLMPGLIFFSFSAVFTSYFQGRGYPPITYIAPLFGLIINTALDIVLLPKIGIIGAPIATSIAYITDALILIIYFRYTTKVPLRKFVLIEKKDISIYKAFILTVLQKIKANIQNRGRI